MKNKFLFFLFLSTFLNTYVVAQQPAFITDSLDIYIQREMQRWQIPGLAITIVKDGKVIVSKGYGVTNLETNQKVDENTLFMIASNTKAFTGTALALLDYQKRLSLNDRVTKHIPYFKLYDEDMTEMATIEDLLSHRLGFETFQGDFLNWDSNLSRRALIENMQKNKPVYDFRDTWGYCNAGFLAAGEIVESVTDTTWDDFIQHNFFKPLDMNHSSTTYRVISTEKNVCVPYTLFENKLIRLEYDSIDNLAAVGGINSCASDLSNWLLMQLNDGSFNGKQVFPPQVVKNTRVPRSIVNAGGSGLYKSQHFNLYGLGWFIKDYEGRRIIMHDGGANGFVTSTCFIPEANLGIAVLTNTDANSLYDALRYQIMEAYFNVPYRNLSEMYFEFANAGNNSMNEQIRLWREKAGNTEKPELVLSKYTGIYENEVYGKIEIKEEKGKLNIYFAHHPHLTG
ncbi:MAG: serine hydrolase, partial [Chitinophagales bacterium]|nr:serine hydrolase [Chitinophagales bacterium]